jgi:hypothetical protein
MFGLHCRGLTTDIFGSCAIEESCVGMSVYKSKVEVCGRFISLSCTVLGGFTFKLGRYAMQFHKSY